MKDLTEKLDVLIEARKAYVGAGEEQDAQDVHFTLGELALLREITERLDIVSRIRFETPEPHVCPVCGGAGGRHVLSATTASFAWEMCKACLGACVLWEPKEKKS